MKSFAIIIQTAAAVFIPGVIAMSAGAAPGIQFASREHDFGKVMADGKARCEFVFTNTGDALLEVTDVKPACGCTVAGTWSRQVEPGGTGVIPLDYHAPEAKGSIEKTIAVTCNDPAHTSVVLQIKATIWKPIELDPFYAILRVPAGSTSSVTTAVRILNNLEQPITLSEPESTNRFFAVELKTIRPGKEFELVVKTVPPLPDNNPQQFIKIKTSSAEAPLVSVPTVAIIEQSLVVGPPKLVLPARPLKQLVEYSVMIRNNDTVPLVLSDPAVALVDSADGLKDLAVQVREVQPGRQFMLTVNLPAGFEVPVGKTLELRVKTSSLQHPVIKVPWCLAPCM